MADNSESWGSRDVQAADLDPEDIEPLMQGGGHLVLAERRDRWLRVVGVVLLSAALLAAAATQWSTRRYGGLRRASVGRLQVKEAARAIGCGVVEEGVDLPDDNFLMVKNISSAEVCQQVCEAEEKCMAWTWGAWKVCYLKSLQEGISPRVLERPEATSGLSARGCAAASRTTPQETDEVSKPSLHCFSYVGTDSERDLVTMQASDRLGIFGCDGTAVYSREAFGLGNGLNSTVVGSPAGAEPDAKVAAELESRWGPVAAAWRRVLADGYFREYGWTVKVDPEAVFLPSRLRLRLVEHPEYESSKGAYLSNCPLGLRKSLEVLSRNAVTALGFGRGECVEVLENLKYLCPGGSCLADEDKFLEQCLNGVLGVERRETSEILADEKCLPPPGWWSCQDSKAIAFSPIETIPDYRQCWDTASNPVAVTSDLATQIAGMLSARPRTTNTSTKTETTTTSTTSTTSLRDPYSLFCFSVMMPTGMELTLVKNQLSRGVSIFACDRWAVYSSEEVWLSPGPPEVVKASNLGLDFNRSPEHVAGALTATWLNTENFIKAWDAVIKDGFFWENSWAVKVDPDAVFFPDRLKLELEHLNTEGEAVYIRNCEITFGFYGALEVVSRKAVGAYSWGKDRCMTQMDRHLMGEDMFFKKCFDFLGIREVTDYQVLNDAYCSTPVGACNSGRSAFHPLKSWDQYDSCLQSAQSAPPPGLQQVVFKQ